MLEGLFVAVMVFSILTYVLQGIVFLGSLMHLADSGMDAGSDKQKERRLRRERARGSRVLLVTWPVAPVLFWWLVVRWLGGHIYDGPAES